MKKLNKDYNFKVCYPKIAKEWNYNLNDKGPEEYYPSSHNNVFWICDKGHIFDFPIIYRVRRYKEKGKIDCPICNKTKCSNYYNLMTEFPDIALEWDYIKNKSLSPDKVLPFSGKKVWWVCSFNNNHRWKAQISNRTSLDRECTICSKTWKISYPAVVLFYYLYKVIPNVEFEVPFEKKYKIDIMLKNEKIAIEHDGFFYHDNKYSISKDNKKIEKLKEKGYKVIVIRDSLNVKSVNIKNNIITYPFDYQNKYLDQMVNAIFKILNLPKVDIDYKRDRVDIKYFYNHMRKKQTLAFKYPKLANEYSIKNKDKADCILPKSSIKALWKCNKCNKEYTATIISRVNHNYNCPHCFIESNNIFAHNPELKKEWDYEKNVRLDPYKLTYGKEIKVWWKCVYGHSWKSYIYSRTEKNKSGCPYCNNTKISKENSIKELLPKLYKYWNTEKNSTINPKEIGVCSNKKVWWKCEYGHEWEQAVISLAKVKKEKYCPYCNDRKQCSENTLDKKRPDLLNEWDYSKNKVLPSEIFYRSHEKVWWKKEKITWEDSVYNRTIKNRTYKKKEKLSTSALFIDIKDEWDYEKNRELTPEKVTPKSGKKAWWRCKNGHSFLAVINKRTSRKDGCPYCSGRRASSNYSLKNNYPDISLLWDYEKNKDLTPEKVTPKSGRKVWWKCEYGHSWKSQICNITLRNHRCPQCNNKRKYSNLKIDFPEIAEEWNYNRNDKKPEDYRSRSNKKVWWKCKNNHEWQATLDSRVSGSNCPICYKNKKTKPYEK